MATNLRISSSTEQIPSPPTSDAASGLASVNNEVPQLFREDAIAKGRAKLLILSGETEVDQTTFTGGMAQLEANGYEVSSEWVSPDEPFPDDLEPAFQALGLSTEVPQYFAEHKYAGSYQGISFDRTGANFWNRVNVHEGVVITENNHSPRWMVSGRRTDLNLSPLRMPPLRRFSDVFGLQFFVETEDEEVEPGTDEVDLNHWFSHDVRNGDTVDVMNGILELEGKDTPGPWPGLVYHPDQGEENGIALLGTPSGSSVAWFIAQHRELFPTFKYVGAVHFFSSIHNDSEDPEPGREFYNLYFEIKTRTTDTPAG